VGDAALHGTGIGTAFHIATNVPVVAYQMLPYGGGSARVTAATLLLPTNVWDTNYVAANAYKAASLITTDRAYPTLEIVAQQDQADSESMGVRTGKEPARSGRISAYMTKPYSVGGTPSDLDASPGWAPRPTRALILRDLDEFSRASAGCAVFLDARADKSPLEVRTMKAVTLRSLPLRLSLVAALAACGNSNDKPAGEAPGNDGGDAGPVTVGSVRDAGDGGGSLDAAGEPADGGPPSSRPDAEACNPMSCASGCCSAGSCVPAAAQNNAACGNGGATCQSCLPGAPCQGGVCQAGPTSGPTPAAPPFCSYNGGGGMSAAGTRLYYVGGADGEGLSLSAASVFDVARNTWTTLPPLLSARIGPAVVSDGDNRIYAIGGYVDSAPPVDESNPAEVFDPSADAWAGLPATPALDSFGAAVVGRDGKVYVVAHASTLAYDPAAGAWTSLPSPSTPRAGGAAAVGSDGRIYVFGGTTEATSGSGLWVPSASSDVFDPSTGVWSPLPPLSVARDGAAAVALPGGQIYIIGGVDGSGTGIASVEIFDVSTQSRSAGPALNQARGYFAAGLGKDGRIYVAAGVTTSGAYEVTVCTAEAYTPGGTSWLLGP
jgi:hypothetical protein